MRFILPLFIVTISSAFGNNGTDILLKNSKGSVLVTPIVKVQKQIILDNPFLVQLYGSFKAANIDDVAVDKYFESIFDKKYSDALSRYFDVWNSKSKHKNLLSASKLFLLWESDLNQTFFNEWLYESASNNFLKTELGVALDQYTSKGASNWLVKNGINFSKSQLALISRIEKHESNFNYSVQALANLRKGTKSLERISYLQRDDELIIPLAQSSVIHFARNNELGKAAKVLKDIYQPVVEKGNDIEQISEYYMILARLLYQAKAYDAANDYYSLIPHKSKKFLEANVESLWLSMRNDDLPTLKGQIKSFEFEQFKDTFLPEVFLVSSMANLQTCQFDAVKDAFTQFVQVNSKMAKEISLEMKKTQPRLIKLNFHTKQLVSSITKTSSELDRFIKRGDAVKWSREIDLLKSQLAEFKTKKNFEATRQWKNRKIMLERSIRNMRFVKIEYLSTMRRLKSKLALRTSQDQISTRQAGRAKSDQVKFPYDGVVFGEELFNLSSEIKNLCLKGKR
jgi:hypothetical protein